MDDGLLDNLDVPVCTFYPEWKQGTKKNITVRHLANMTTGLQNVPNATVEIYPSKDFVQLALAAEMSAKPGEFFNYNNKSLNLLSGLIKKITGKRMDHYIGERLFRPLGITNYAWTLDEAGNPHVMSGCQIRPIDHIKMGLLLLNNGKYNGQQVISEKNIRQVVEPCSQYKGYGMLWWIDYATITFRIDDEVIKPMIEAGIEDDFVSKMQRIKGDYDSNEAFFKKLQEVFGPNPKQEIAKALGNHDIEVVNIIYGAIELTGQTDTLVTILL